MQHRNLLDFFLGWEYLLNYLERNQLLFEKQAGDSFLCPWVAGELLVHGGVLQSKTLQKEHSFLQVMLHLDENIVGQSVWIGNLKGEKRVLKY